jgi:hypothetical protein
MKTATFTTATRRELAHRVTGGLEIRLYWDAHDNSTSIEVQKRETAEAISFPVAGDRALDAFHHPFAHLAQLAVAGTEPFETAASKASLRGE